MYQYQMRMLKRLRDLGWGQNQAEAIVKSRLATDAIMRNQTAEQAAEQVTKKFGIHGRGYNG